MRNLDVDVVLSQSHRNWLKDRCPASSPPLSTVSYGNMHDLLRYPCLAAEMGGAARRTALDRFSIDRFVDD